MKTKSPLRHSLHARIFAALAKQSKASALGLAATFFFCASIAQGATLFSQTAKIGRSGGTLGDLSTNAIVSLAPGTITNGSRVTLHVDSNPPPRVLGDGYLASPSDVRLKLDPRALSATGTITITLPFVGAYDTAVPSSTTIMVETKGGRRLSLPSTLADSSHLTGQLGAATVRQLHAKPGKNGRVILRLFTSNGQPQLPSSLITSVQSFQNGAFQPNTAVPPLSGRVALCVHGIESDLADLTELAAHLASRQQAGHPYYDYIIGFQYTSNAPLQEIGNALANSMQGVLTAAGITQVDVFAHSMGNPVSRWAIEQGNAGYRLGPLRGGGHYVSLGGPHTGIPFGDLRLYNAFASYFPIAARPLLQDLATTGKNGPPTYSNFLTLLDPASSPGPDYATAHYYSASASDPYEELPLGPPGAFLYYLAVYPEKVVDDGLVAVYSAQNPVLGRESQTWQPGPTLYIGHHDLVTDTEDPSTGLSPFDVIDQWMATWN